MKAYVVENATVDSLDQVKLVELDKPRLAVGEVLVKVHATGLNPVDYKLVEGGNSSWAYPHVLGLDMAGEIVELGEGVTDWSTGMRVSGHLNLTKNGCFAEYVSVPTYELAQIPENVSYEQAAAMLCGALTAYQTINRKPNLNNVHTVLVQAGSGSVGSLAVQFAKLHGLRVATTCSTGKVDFTSRTGADLIIDYKTQNVAQEVEEFTDGHGVDLIIDPVSGAEAESDFDMLAYNGQLVTIVGVPPVDSNRMFANAFSMAVVNLGGAHESGNPEQKRDLGRMNAEVLELVSDGKVDPLLGEILPFDRLIDGLRMLKNHENIGKLVVSIAQ
ncbi:zinc-binding dehydrogenase [Bifidobacterium gallicum]|uniref:Alcohol dehydrogenase n=1 Tax=Bifidobacterium gallicum DSM 20093 = LMG 11596 TaxID=561180 RepID=D1NV53_9BIFI|nr:zinc-binding dehydrogenase [Bifidobacterium gallicum]EFA22704.1 GroES-like protein [Bifidobacterium gallicum DSM 20093 = LMG 11596]KFI59655.1 alcohol dehydrogenase [Bifidobacterium gallicum DSM 20093 = LMG 11596]